jgi:hypothetical protein
MRSVRQSATRSGLDRVVERNPHGILSSGA